jgi:hypothetical protein
MSSTIQVQEVELRVASIQDRPDFPIDSMLSEAVLSEVQKAAQTESTWREFSAKPLEVLGSAKLDLQDLKVTPSPVEFTPLKKPLVLKPAGIGGGLTHICGYRWITFTGKVKKYTFTDPLTHEKHYVWYTFTTRIKIPIFC